MHLKITIILCCFVLIPSFISSQIQSSIDIIGSYDFTNTVSYLPGIFLNEGGGRKFKQGGRSGYRFGFNANFRVRDKILFKTGLRYSRQGHLSDAVERGIDSLDRTVYELKRAYLDEYYIEVPVIFRYEKVIKRFSLFIELGFSPHWYLKGKKVTYYKLFIPHQVGEGYDVETLDDLNTTEDFESPFIKDTRIRFAYIMGIGLNFDITKFMQIFVQPTFRYFPSVKSEASKVQGTAILQTKNMGIEFGVRRAFSYKH